MKKSFDIHHLMDLDHLLEQREGMDTLDRQALEREDRKIYREEILPAISGKNLSDNEKNAFILKHWIGFAKKRNPSAEGGHPGEVFYQVYSLLVTLFLLGGAFAGFGAAGGFLAYSGKNPVNVTMFFFTFVICQVMFLILPVFTILFSRRAAVFNPRAGGMGLIASMALWAGRIISEKFVARGSGAGSLAFFQRRRKRYGSCLIWPFFNLGQLFAMSFNSGVLGSTLLRVVSTDLAFGWQSTLSFGHETVSGVVRLIALPWTWILGSANSYPDLLQIQGSRIILKEGSQSLMTADLVSWWPFLCLSVFTYVLLPRIVFYIAGLVMQKRALFKYGFSAAVVRRFLMVLETETVGMECSPQVEPQRISGSDIKAELSIDNSINGPVPEDKIREPAEDTPSDVIPADRFGSSCLLVHGPVHDLFPEDAVKASVCAVTGRSMVKCLQLELDPDKDIPMLKKEFFPPENDTPENVYVVLEGWMPPIRETLVYFMDLRELFGEGVCIFIMLAGRGKDEELSREQFKIWKSEILSLGDPGVYVEKLNL